MQKRIFFVKKYYELFGLIQRVYFYIITYKSINLEYNLFMT